MNEHELEINEAKAMKLDGEAMARLTNNRDFKRVFTSMDRGLLKSGALELVGLLAQPNIPKDMQEENGKRLFAMSFLSQYIENIVILGRDAEIALNSDDGEG